MDGKLRDDFFSAMMRFKKMESAFAAECEIQMNELAILQIIAGKCACSDCVGVNLDVPGVQEKLQISKPAVSYILNTLEKKAYIMREIDVRDRRKISISATPEGIEAAERFTRRSDALWDRLLAEFGEADMGRLVELLTRLSELFERMQCES